MFQWQQSRTYPSSGIQFPVSCRIAADQPRDANTSTRPRTGSTDLAIHCRKAVAQTSGPRSCPHEIPFNSQQCAAQRYSPTGRQYGRRKCPLPSDDWLARRTLRSRHRARTRPGDAQRDRLPKMIVSESAVREAALQGSVAARRRNPLRPFPRGRRSPYARNRCPPLAGPSPRPVASLCRTKGA